MPLYVLDTDNLTFHQTERDFFMQHIRSVPPETVCTTVITLYEQMRGRVARVHRAETSAELIAACEHLRKTVWYFSHIRILPFTSDAARFVARFKDEKIRVGTQDLRIASIVLSVNGILVTSNRRDFQKIPGLLLEDWNTPL